MGRLLIGCLAAVVPLTTAAQDTDAALVARARAIHDRVITIDTHVDIEPAYFTTACNYTQRLTTQVNLPKMQQGGLDVAFLVVNVSQGVLSQAGYADAYRRPWPDSTPCTGSSSSSRPRWWGSHGRPTRWPASRRAGAGVAVIGIENGYPVGTDLSHVRDFYERGGRYMSLAHNGGNQLSDSHSEDAAHEAPNGGLTPLGRAVIAEMNRLGMMVDVSHASRRR